MSVAKFYGKTTLVIGGNGGTPTTTVPTTQSNHVYKVAGSFTYNQPRSLSLVQSDFSSCYSLSSTYSSSNLDATTTNNQLYANKPVYVRIQWSGTTDGHFILITGYLTANSLYNELLNSLSSEQREVLAKLVQDARIGGIHDTLAYMNEKMDCDGLVLSQNGEEFPFDEFESMHYDFVCRCEGDEWPI